jgi:glucose-1-phosphate thymidylyltransferase
MDAVIPAAKRGSRLGELTADRPKGLVEVAGRPLLSHIFETAVEADADELVVVGDVVRGFRFHCAPDRRGDVDHVRR